MHLHLIEPLGFSLDEKSCRRAGLDYHSLTKLTTWPSFSHYLQAEARPKVWAITKFGKTCYTDVVFSPGDTLLFGSEQTGLPHSIQDNINPENQLYIPMQTGSRSLNLSNAVAIVLYEAWRQTGFCGDSQKISKL